ncbi:hypothetical protein [Azospirillum lipoferum]|uniref:Uncharacterized protein n=1 Tax=Azospirillum lipoferum (strain 4B) TaxID=862719 RepID=G7ZED7_AZOL4|nr:hypothetical protein [Azospirillum lipoferum]CBS90056.1 Protein of unknown function [Azospirillum lipoferum 4B]
MSHADHSKAQQVVDDVVARLVGAGLSDAERAEACEATLRQLMAYLIEREGWLAEEFAAIARSLGAY